MLHAFQERTVEWMLQKEADPVAFGVVLSATGLGKSITTLAAVHRARLQSPIGPSHRTHVSSSLIITRPALLDQWLRLCMSWFPALQVYVYHGRKRKDQSRFPEAMARADVVLTTNRTLLSDAHFQRRRARYLDNCKNNKGKGMTSPPQQRYLSYLASLRPRDLQPVRETRWRRVVYDDVHNAPLAAPLEAAFRWGIGGCEFAQLPGHVWLLLNPDSTLLPVHVGRRARIRAPGRRAAIHHPLRPYRPG
jgi:SNF2 family DNA or RNA helicase